MSSRNVKGMWTRNRTLKYTEWKRGEKKNNLLIMYPSVLIPGPVHYRPRASGNIGLGGCSCSVCCGIAQISRLPRPEKKLRTVLCSDPLWKTWLYWKFGTDAVFRMTCLKCKSDCVTWLPLFLPPFTSSVNSSHVSAEAWALC